MSDTNNLFRLVTPFLDQMQILENALGDLRQKRQFVYATGEQLDNIGDILNVARNGLPDSEFVTALNNAIAFNNSCGTPNILINYTKAIVSGSILYYEPYPGVARIIIPVLPTPLYLLHNLFVLKPAGITLEIELSTALGLTWADEGAFSNPGYGLEEDGYSESHGYIGGIISEMMVHI